VESPYTKLRPKCWQLVNMKKIAHFCVLGTSNIGDNLIIEEIHKDFSKLDKKVKINQYPISLLSTGSILQFLKAIIGADAIVIGGGGIISRFFWPFRTIHLRIIQALNKPTYLLAAGIGLKVGETIDSLPKENIKEWLQNMTAVSVRDIASMESLRKIGIENLELTGDAALSMPKLPYVPQKRPKVIGLNIANHGWEAEEKILDLVVNPMVGKLKAIEKQGYSFSYLAHHKGEKIIYEKLSQHLNILYTEVTLENYSQLYSSLYCHVGMMLHSTIFSLKSNTPFLNIVYDEKNIAFLKLLSLERNAIKIEDIENTDFVVHLESTVREWHENQRHLKKEIEKFVSRRLNFISKIADEI